MTNDQKKMLTEKLLKECYNYEWWCPECSRRVDGIDVTFMETHDLRSGGCGEKVVPSKYSRTFLTWQDLGDLKEALVREGLWGLFHSWGFEQCEEEEGYGSEAITTDEFDDWLFRPVDEKGNPHFARLVAEFMESCHA